MIRTLMLGCNNLNILSKNIEKLLKSKHYYNFIKTNFINTGFTFFLQISLISQPLHSLPVIHIYKNPHIPNILYNFQLWLLCILQCISAIVKCYSEYVCSHPGCHSVAAYLSDSVWRLIAKYRRSLCAASRCGNWIRLPASELFMRTGVS